MVIWEGFIERYSSRNFCKGHIYQKFGNQWQNPWYKWAEHSKSEMCRKSIFSVIKFYQKIVASEVAVVEESTLEEIITANMTWNSFCENFLFLIFCRFSKITNMSQEYENPRWLLFSWELREITKQNTMLYK